MALKGVRFEYVALRESRVKPTGDGTRLENERAYALRVRLSHPRPMEGQADWRRHLFRKQTSVKAFGVRLPDLPPWRVNATWVAARLLPGAYESIAFDSLALRQNGGNPSVFHEDNSQRLVAGSPCTPCRRTSIVLISAVVHRVEARPCSSRSRVRLPTTALVLVAVQSNLGQPSLRRGRDGDHVVRAPASTRDAFR